jgi:hypothetical protein
MLAIGQNIKSQIKKRETKKISEKILDHFFGKRMKWQWT